MTIRWSEQARDDVDRLSDFVSSYDPALADEIERELELAPRKLLDFPRRGTRLSRYDPLEVREFRVLSNLLRYQLAGSDIFVLRFFHAKEDRA